MPQAFLAEELRGADDAIEALDKTMHAEDDTSRRAAYDELREAVEDNVRIKRRLINRLMTLSSLLKSVSSGISKRPFQRFIPQRTR